MQEKSGNPQNEESKYPHLSHELIEGVKTSIMGEVERSKPYGFIVGDDLIKRETDYFLQKLDDLSQKKPLADFRWDDFRNTISETMHGDFKDMIDFFHNENTRNGKDLRTFDYHLEYVRSAIVTLVEEKIGLRD